jgi:hypothetical protein
MVAAQDMCILATSGSSDDDLTAARRKSSENIQIYSHKAGGVGAGSTCSTASTASPNSSLAEAGGACADAVLDVANKPSFPNCRTQRGGVSVTPGGGERRGGAFSDSIMDMQQVPCEALSY